MEEVYKLAQEWLDRYCSPDYEIDEAAAEAGFVSGYEAAMPKWISVKKRRPPVGEWVTVWGTWDASRYPLEKDTGMFDGKRWNQVSCDNDGERYTFDVVTHWLELKVEGPEEEK